MLRLDPQYEGGNGWGGLTLLKKLKTASKECIYAENTLV